MKTNKKEAGKNTKPVQEALPSNKQKPNGTDADLKRNAEYMKGDDSDNTNSVGIVEKQP